MGFGSLNTTKLETLTIEEEKLYWDYPQIGSGSEANILNYKNKYALKRYHSWITKQKLASIFAKAELLGQIKDENFCFPLGFYGYEDGLKEGIFFELIKTHSKYYDFYHLKKLEDRQKMIEILLTGGLAIKRIHQQGIFIGDIKSNNILLDQDLNPKFVDTDSYAFNGYDFSLEFATVYYLEEVYNKSFSLDDIENFSYARVVLECLCDGLDFYRHKNDAYFAKMIELMDIDQELKDGLRQIFSDAKEKEEIGHILRRIKPDNKLLTKEQIKYLDHYY